MEVVKSTEDDLREIMQWFDTSESAISWGGPRIRFPLSVEKLKEDINWNEMTSYSFYSEKKLN